MATSFIKSFKLLWPSWLISKGFFLRKGGKLEKVVASDDDLYLDVDTKESLHRQLDELQGPPEFHCHDFHSYAPDQHCRQLCLDNKNTEMNVFAYLKDQKAAPSGAPVEDTCYYARGEKLKTPPNSEREKNMIK